VSGLASAAAERFVMQWTSIIGLTMTLSLTGQAQAADLRFARIFTDHCVLQRDVAAPIWGWAGAGEEITVSFGGQRKSAVADASGRWLVRLDPLSACNAPRDLIITSGEHSVMLRDVLVGDLWIAGGQSNMGFSISASTHAVQARREIPHPLLRRFKVGSALADQPLVDLDATGVTTRREWQRGDEGRWHQVDNERFSLDWMSAVAAWFAHDLRISQGVPIGIIESHFGGSKLHCWMPIESLRASPEFTRDVLEPSARQKASWDESMALRRTDPVAAAGPPPTEPWRPACLYNAMIAPLEPLALRGVIWYQGESDVGRAEPYRRQLPALVRSWRQGFGRDNLAFLAVQLPAYGQVRQWPRSAWAEMRESIACLERSLPLTATVVATDCGEPAEIHPRLKKPIGQRLALAARSCVYGEPDLVWSGPTFRRAEFATGRCTVHFNHVGGGLVARGESLSGFALAGLDQVFHPARGEIVGQTVVIETEAVPEPVAVRYAWQDSPVANLWNRAGLPAGSFRSDLWELMTQAPIATPLVLTTGGTPKDPAVFDGQGMLIDLGKDISDQAWIEADDLWTSQPNLLSQYGQTPRIAGQMAGLFVAGMPITIPRDLEAERARPEKKSRCYVEPTRLRPGEMTYAEDGSVSFRWPQGTKPGKTRSTPIVLPAKEGVSGVSIACSHIVVRNITVRHAGNDGFNIHGHRRGIRLERVRCLSNADEGISAHETTELEVVGAEVAWNGSAAGGVADVNDSVTTYRDCIVHDNAGAAFFFGGRSHAVFDTLIFHEERDFAVQQGTSFVQERVRWLGDDWAPHAGWPR
jgi:sialate O-acetylesterase